MLDSTVERLFDLLFRVVHAHASQHRHPRRHDLPEVALGQREGRGVRQVLERHGRTLPNTGPRSDGDG